MNRIDNPLITSLVPGLLTGILAAIMSVSLAALVFSGPLSAFIGEGIALAINTAIISGLGITLFSRCRPIISMVDEDTAPIFALLASFVVASLPAGSSDSGIFTAAIAAIVITTLISGIGLTLLGMFRFGNFIQFLPHSVMGGYFSAVGWLLVVGGLQVTTGTDPVTREGFEQLFTLHDANRWWPGVVIAIWLMAMRHRVPLNTLLPGTVLLAAGAWFLVNWFSGGSPNQAMDQGLLLGPFDGQGARLLTPLAGLDPAGVEWIPIFANSGSMASIFLIAVLSMMLCISGLSFLTRNEPDMNYELKVAGVANITSGLGGGMTGLPSYSLSSLALKMGAPQSRWTSVLAVAVCLLVYLFGLDLLAYTPRFILTGILIYLGLTFLYEWLIQSWKKFSFLEYLVIPIILGVAIFAGFLQGVVVGLIAAIVLFAVKYSQTRAVAYTTTGAELMSNVDRTAAAQQVIQDNADHVLAMSLQGYLFFGTAGQVYARLKDRLSETSRAKLNYLIIDFSRVTGLDASAAQNFQRILQRAITDDFTLVMAGLPPVLDERLSKGGFGATGSDHLVTHPDLDHALEWSENRLLENYREAQLGQSCFEQIAEYLSPSMIERLMIYLVRKEVEAGYLLAEQGDESNQLIFLETCAASAFIRDSKNEMHRVRRTTSGTVFGELGFYLNIPRTATVVTEEAGLIYLLDQQSLEKMEQNDPEVAAGLHRYMAKLLSERLMFTTRTLRAMLL